jgi:hypothetical protein
MCPLALLFAQVSSTGCSASARRGWQCQDQLKALMTVAAKLANTDSCCLKGFQGPEGALL